MKKVHDLSLKICRSPQQAAFDMIPVPKPVVHQYGGRIELDENYALLEGLIEAYKSIPLSVFEAPGEDASAEVEAVLRDDGQEEDA